MRANTPREQLLQNLLAMSSVLLFRANKQLAKGSQAERDALIIDIEEWFEESQDAIARELELEYAVIPERRAVPRQETPWVPPTPIIRDEDSIPIPKLNYFTG